MECLNDFLQLSYFYGTFFSGHFNPSILRREKNEEDITQSHLDEIMEKKRWKERMTTTS